MRAVKYVGLMFMLMASAIVLYSAQVVYAAKSYAKEIILSDLKANTYRLYGGNPRNLHIQYNDLSTQRKQWLLAIQDPGYEQHYGVDLSTPGAGLTTITQSIVKKLYFENFSPGIAKFKQSLIAIFVIDELLNKNQQLELFLNLSYMGQHQGSPVYGFENAAQIYFGKSFTHLTDDEYLALIALLIGPDQYSIAANPDANAARVARVKQVISGKYQPKGLMDVYYDG